MQTYSHPFSFNLFRTTGSKSEYFKKFSSLKSIIYLNQFAYDFYNFNRVTRVDMSLWPGYRLLKAKIKFGLDVELKRNLIILLVALRFKYSIFNILNINISQF
jgi:hypothetical protein